MNSALQQVVAQKKGCDIVIIGKGPSVDKIDLSLFKNCTPMTLN